MDIQKEQEQLLSLLGNDERKVNLVLNFRHKLTPSGFELYIAKFFEKFGWFKTISTGWFLDQCIDVKWVRLNAAWEKEYLIVQCKKWSAYETWENDVAKFLGKVTKYKQKYPNTYLVFSTTNKGNLRARRFCEDNNIVFTDYTDLPQMQETYSLFDFQKFIYSTTEYYNVREKIFPKHFVEILDKSTTDTKDVGSPWSKFLQEIFSQKTKTQVKTKKDLYSLLKEVRKDFAQKENLPLHCIFSNQILEDICKIRPRNMTQLKTIHGIKDRKAEKYGERILEIVGMC